MRLARSLALVAIVAAAFAVWCAIRLRALVHAERHLVIGAGALEELEPWGPCTGTLPGCVGDRHSWLCPAYAEPF